MSSSSPEFRRPQNASPPRSQASRLGDFKKRAGWRDFHFGSSDMNKLQPFPTNHISSTRYSSLSYLPRTLLIVIRNEIIIYFIIISIVQAIPNLSDVHPFSSFVPLVFVVALSVIREGFEDLNRQYGDHELNSQKAIRYKEGKWMWTNWSSILVGDIIRVHEGLYFPADVVLMGSSLPNGSAYIETASIDGEKSLKTKTALPETMECVNGCQPLRLVGKIGCPEPSSDLKSFEGMVNVGNGYISLSISQFIMRGSKLRNTIWAIAVVVYTGSETKIMRNNEPMRAKRSLVTKRLQIYVRFMFLVVFLCSLFGFIGSVIWNCVFMSEYSYFFDVEQRTCALEAFLNFWRILLLINTMIPISLIISLEIVRMVLAYFIEKDMELGTKDFRARVYNPGILEDLGQISYILTDKTGTLTMNKMEFKYCLIGNRLFGKDDTGEEDPFDTGKKEAKDEKNSGSPTKKGSKSPSPSGNSGESKELKQGAEATKKRIDELKSGVVFNFWDPELTSLMQGDEETNDTVNLSIYNSHGSGLIGRIKTQRELCHEFFLILSLCHQCIPERDPNTGYLHYQGHSPDEICLVDAARNLGYEFISCTDRSIIVKIMGEVQKIDLLRVFDFDSNRKRMSIVIRQKGIVKVLMKGADDEVFGRLASERIQPFLEDCSFLSEEFAYDGFRTMAMAVKYMTVEEWSIYDESLRGVSAVGSNAEVYDRIVDDLEKNMYLIGLTALEDQLHEGVPDLINDFLKANIKVWMLTGDKMLTAKTVANSCKLIQRDFMELILGENDDPKGKIGTFKSQVQALEKKGKRVCFIAEGNALASILAAPALKEQYAYVMSKCDTVVCCRMNPRQKAEIVRMVKYGLGKAVLAIGDGANDMNMIQEATVGVSVTGAEGTKQSGAADFVVMDFKCLWKLLFVHGRWGYIRITKLILYFFYKNILFSAVQLWHLYPTAWSAVSLFDDWYIVFFNLLFTSVPIVVWAIFDQDINHKSWAKGRSIDGYIVERSGLRESFPRLYYIGQENEEFRGIDFIYNIVIGFIHSLIIYIFCAIALGDNIVDELGFTPDYWFFSLTIYTSIIFVVNFKLSQMTKYWTIFNFISILFLSFGVFISYIWGTDHISSTPSWMTARNFFQSAHYFFLVFFTLALLVGIDNFLVIIQNEFFASLQVRYKEIVRKGYEMTPMIFEYQYWQLRGHGKDAWGWGTLANEGYDMDFYDDNGLKGRGRYNQMGFEKARRLGYKRYGIGMRFALNSTKMLGSFGEGGLRGNRGMLGGAYQGMGAGGLSYKDGEEREFDGNGYLTGDQFDVAGQKIGFREEGESEDFVRDKTRYKYRELRDPNREAFEDKIRDGKLIGGFAGVRSIHFGITNFHENQYTDNGSATTSYSFICFLPQALLRQLSKLVNIYFIFIALLQSIPILTPISPITAVAPLLLVISLSVLRESFEDLNRYEAALETNARKTIRLTNHRWVLVDWKDLIVGDIVKVNKDQMIPADLVLIASSSENGICFIETSSLDGEKTLKPRIALPQCTECVGNGVPLRLSGKLVCPESTPDLHVFDGYINMGGMTSLPLTIRQFLYRGSYVRNTDWVIGVVAYTGSDTKILKTSQKYQRKYSIIEKRMTSFISILVVALLVICFCFGVASVIWHCTFDVGYTYFMNMESSCGLEGLLGFFRSIILLNTIIPISLVVSIEIIRMTQAFFVSQDADLESPLGEVKAKAISSVINENLGLIEYVFTDKTGTLTVNEMEFKYCVIGDLLYGRNKEEFHKRVAMATSSLPFKESFLPDINNPGPNYEIYYKEKTASTQTGLRSKKWNFSDPELDELLQDHGMSFVPRRVDMNMLSANSEELLYQIRDQSDLAKEFMMIMAVCHDCILDRDKKTGKISYHGQSQDEIALVDAARRLGFAFNGFKGTKIEVIANGRKEEIEFLALFPFTSERKRMSVIVKHRNVIKLYMKGADSMMFERMAQTESTLLASIKKKLLGLSIDGYRTLVLGMRAFSEDDWSQIQKKLEAIGAPCGYAEGPEAEQKLSNSFFVSSSPLSGFYSKGQLNSPMNWKLSCTLLGALLSRISCSRWSQK